jgi:hypothetical protein
MIYILFFRADTAAAGGLSQRVVCSLMEENLMPSKDSIEDKDGKGINYYYFSGTHIF